MGARGWEFESPLGDHLHGSNSIGRVPVFHTGCCGFDPRLPYFSVDAGQRVFTLNGMKSKPFEQSLHDENDLPAREVVKQFYARLGFVLEDNPDRYGVDLVTGDYKLSVEVERRPVWESGDFPFVMVNFLQRKTKFFVNTPYVLSDYAIVSKDLKRVGIIDQVKIIDAILTSKATEKPNRYVNDSEFFYEIPRKQFAWFDI